MSDDKEVVPSGTNGSPPVQDVVSPNATAALSTVTTTNQSVVNLLHTVVVISTTIVAGNVVTSTIAPTTPTTAHQPQPPNAPPTVHSTSDAETAAAIALPESPRVASDTKQESINTHQSALPTGQPTVIPPAPPVEASPSSSRRSSRRGKRSARFVPSGGDPWIALSQRNRLQRHPHHPPTLDEILASVPSPPPPEQPAGTPPSTPPQGTLQPVPPSPSGRRPKARPIRVSSDVRFIDEQRGQFTQYENDVIDILQRMGGGLADPRDGRYIRRALKTLSVLKGGNATQDQQKWAKQHVESTVLQDPDDPPPTMKYAKPQLSAQVKAKRREDALLLRMEEAKRKKVTPESIPDTVKRLQLINRNGISREEYRDGEYKRMQADMIKVSKPLQQTKMKKKDEEALVKRVVEDDKERRQQTRKAGELKHRFEPPKGKPMGLLAMDDHLRRIYNDPVNDFKGHRDRLVAKYEAEGMASPLRGPLTKQEEHDMTTRLITETLEKREENKRKLYIDTVQSKEKTYKRMQPHEFEELVLRLAPERLGQPGR